MMTSAEEACAIDDGLGLDPYLSALALQIGAIANPLSRQDISNRLVDKCRELGLDSTVLEAHLLKALHNPMTLGPDERAEYTGYLTKVWPRLEETTGIDAIQDGLEMLGNVLVKSIATHVCGCRATPVFLGTDAEFLKVCYQGLSGHPRSIAFYISRKSLMAPDEARTLSRLRNDGIWRVGADGSATKRYYTWLDNSISQIVLYRLLRMRPTLDAFSTALAMELVDQPIQRECERNGWLTLFGVGNPEIDRVMQQGIKENWLLRVCLRHLRLFEIAVLSRTRNIMLVDIGALGSQPYLLAALVSIAVEMAGKDAEMRALGLDTSDKTMLQRVAENPPTISVLLYGPSAMTNEGLVQRLRVSAELSMAIESMKSIVTSYDFDPAHPRRMLRPPPAHEALLAHFKHLVFRNVVVAHRREGDAAGSRLAVRSFHFRGDRDL